MELTRHPSLAHVTSLHAPPPRHRRAAAMAESADALLKKADKKMSTTMMRWRPDYDAASTLYEEAGKNENMFKFN